MSIMKLFMQQCMCKILDGTQSLKTSVKQCMPFVRIPVKTVFYTNSSTSPDIICYEVFVETSYVYFK